MRPRWRKPGRVAERFGGSSAGRVGRLWKAGKLVLLTFQSFPTAPAPPGSVRCKDAGRAWRIASRFGRQGPEGGLPHSGPTADRRTSVWMVGRAKGRSLLRLDAERELVRTSVRAIAQAKGGSSLLPAAPREDDGASALSLARPREEACFVPRQRGIVGGSRPSRSFGEGRRLASNRRGRPDFGSAGAMIEACLDRKPAEGEGVSAPTRFATGPADLVPVGRRRRDPLRRGPTPGEGRSLLRTDPRETKGLRLRGDPSVRRELASVAPQGKPARLRPGR
jgi:hypothetical protein